jgi:hypothetical protein
MRVIDKQKYLVTQVNIGKNDIRVEMSMISVLEDLIELVNLVRTIKSINLTIKTKRKM